MNQYCEGALHHIRFALLTVEKMMDFLEEEDLEQRPTEGKQSARELLSHLAGICSADLLIAKGTAEKEVADYYASLQYGSIAEMKASLWKGYLELEDTYHNFTVEQLHQKTVSYWGAAYTAYEWLLEILAHLYHHRGQLHAMMVHCMGKDPGIPLFE